MGHGRRLLSSLVRDGRVEMGRRALRAACWLLGNNDKDALLYEAESGGTFDGLTLDGVNLNQGAESTLAGIGTLQVAANCWRDLESTRVECATYFRVFLASFAARLAFLSCLFCLRLSPPPSWCSCRLCPCCPCAPPSRGMPTVTATSVLSHTPQREEAAARRRLPVTTSGDSAELHGTRPGQKY